MPQWDLFIHICKAICSYISDVFYVFVSPKYHQVGQYKSRVFRHKGLDKIWEIELDLNLSSPSTSYKRGLLKKKCILEP